MDYSNVCYFEMVNCDIYCNWLMRLKCRIRVRLYRLFTGNKPLPKMEGSEK